MEIDGPCDPNSPEYSNYTPPSYSYDIQMSFFIGWVLGFIAACSSCGGIYLLMKHWF